MTLEGLITLASDCAPKETMDRVAAAVTELGMSILARIDHALAAVSAGPEQRPTEGSHFRQSESWARRHASCSNGVGLLKVLVRQDEKGKVWLALPCLQ